MQSDQLIPIDRVAKIAKTDKIHLAYLTKLRLLPQAIRRKIDGKISGCYPEDVLPKVRQIEEMKNRGLTYSQIRYQLNEATDVRKLTYSPSNSPVAFLIIGLLIGYILANLNTINSKQAVTAAARPNLPVDNQVYLIAMPSENLYKLGKVEFNDLVQ